MGPIWRDDLIGGFGLAVIDLPAPLRQAVDEALQGIPPAELARAAEALSKRYRAELRDGRRHLDDDPAVLAYLATRLPATYAAVLSCLEVARRDPARFRAATAARCRGRSRHGALGGGRALAATRKGAADRGQPGHAKVGRAAGRQAGDWAAGARHRLEDGRSPRRIRRYEPPRSRGPRLCAGRAGACCAARPHRSALGRDRRHASADRARDAGGLAANPGGPRAAAGRRGDDRGALPPCRCLPAAAAGLVSFRPPRGALPPASPGEDGRSFPGRTRNSSISPCRGCRPPRRRRAFSRTRGRARAMSG